MADIIQFNGNQQNDISIEPAQLINALKCIDTAAQRGAFYGGELSSVGGVRDALYAKVEPMLKELEKQKKAQEEAEGTASEETTISED